jgi:hypothetical protein
LPLKPSYLALTGAGAIIVYSGLKGKGLSSAVRTVIGGQSPANAAQTTALITPAQYGYGAQSLLPSTGGGSGSTSTPQAGGAGAGAPSGGPGSTVGLTLSKAAAKTLGFGMVVAAGWGSQWSAFNNIVMAESGWDTTIHNGGGHGYVPGLAYGIPQALPGTKMASAGSNWLTSAATQIKWMIGYIKQVYGDPDNAWSFHLSHGYY